MRGCEEEPPNEDASAVPCPAPPGTGGSVFAEHGTSREGSGASAACTCDSLGNVLSVTTSAAGAASIIDFTPNNGPVGTSVRIYGSGFSEIASQNTVRFNGVSATVASATTTSIVATVPASATTSPISVTTPNGSATSSASFVVAACNAPTITGFTPSIGTPGTAVTITGTNFQPVAGNNKVRFNTGPAVVSSVSPTSIQTSVLSPASSGKITVTTPYGRATSTNDFIVPPEPYTAVDVEVTSRMAIGRLTGQLH